MSYTQQQAYYSRVAATALLALSAGACVGVALSFSPAVSSLYAPVAVRPVVASRVASSYVPQTAVQAGRVFSADQQLAAVAEEPVVITSTPSVNMWTLLSGGVAAGLAAVAAIMYKSGKAEQSEQIAMLAVFGKKAAPAATKISKVKEARPLWYPTAEPPEWLDGSLPGDRGFDPLGLAKPTEYLQMDLDALDQNAPKNVAGDVIGRVAAQPDQVSTDALQPYSEVFGLQRFRECELIHGRWAMLAVLGVLVSEAFTGVAWQNAGLVEVQNGASYFGFSLPFTNSQVVWFEVLAMGGVEVFRNSELDLDKRCYPGGAFDPLGFTSKDEAQTFRLKEAELKHGRLAMLAFLGFAIAAAKTGYGATEAFNQWATTTFG